MVNELSILAEEMVKTIEIEDMFYELKQQGCFVKMKAKDVRDGLNENWDYV